MDEHDFSTWINWDNRNSLDGLKLPGVYCLALSDVDLSCQEFKWIKEITYVGMTNSQGGLKSRLNQFDNTINGKSGHGGADRFSYKHQSYDDLINQLYVSVCPFQCDVKSQRPEDLRIMGEIAKFEYDCMAIYVEKFGHLPEFNDKKRSPKYSLKRI